MVQSVVTPANLGTEFDIGVITSNAITIKVATTTTSGKVARLATAGDVGTGVAGAVVDSLVLKNAIAGFTGGINYQGTWNPVTNTTPQLLSGVGTKGYMYKLSANGVVNNTTSTAASTTAVIAVASAAGIVPGQLVTGTGVPATTTVVSVAGNNVTVSQAVSIASGAALVFATYLDNAGPFYSGDQVIYDGTTWDKFDSVGETSLNVTDAFGNHLYYSAP